jgi:hypothetical protein
MQTLSVWAYGVRLGAFPLIAVVGLATYGAFALAALVTIVGRRTAKVRRLAFRAHRPIAYVAILLATVHLLLGLSLYV